jgi:hypothetical protein
MATSHQENEPLDERFGALLEDALRNPPEETTTRDALVRSREKIVRCLKAGISRRFLHTQFLKAGGVVSYQRLCVLLNDLLRDEETVNGIKRKTFDRKGRAGNRECGTGSKLIAARRREGGIGKTLEEIQRESAEALVRVAGL